VGPPPIPRSADVVVVGGGCMGASLAFHFARLGVDAVLVEKAHLASGATGHSGALVRQHYETRIGVRLARDSLAFFQRFPEETGTSCDLRTTGFLSGTREGDLRAFDALFDLLKSEGVRVERLAPDEAKALEPALDVSDYVALVHDRDAGYADPIATAAGLASAASRDGARILEGPSVREALVRRGKVAGIRLRGGRTIAASRVVLAAGNWTRGLAAKAGVRLPITFSRGYVALLRRPWGFGPAPRLHFDFYARTYSRPEGDKDTLVGFMDREPRETIRGHELRDDSVPAPIVRELRSRLAKRFPAMARAQPRGGWAGVYDFTPDAYPILDRVGPGGLFVAAGFSGHGFKLCPEIGRLLAEFIATGRRPEAIRPLSASRFHEGRPVRPDAPFPRRRGRRLT
jgi:sarcosine oxidase subunit beta